MNLADPSLAWGVSCSWARNWVYSSRGAFDKEEEDEEKEEMEDSSYEPKKYKEEPVLNVYNLRGKKRKLQWSIW